MTKPSHLSDADLARLRTALSHKRDALLASESSSQGAQRGIGDAEAEQGDRADQLIEQESALRVGQFDAQLLAQVNGALARLEAGTYGTSEVSGSQIPLDRLTAVPWTTRTADEEDRAETAAR